MGRYFFNLRAGANYIPDPVGQEHADLEEAKEEAVVAAREIVAEQVKTGEVIEQGEFEITDASGALCLTLPFREVLRFS
jgi:hypothetical protein